MNMCENWLKLCGAERRLCRRVKVLSLQQSMVGEKSLHWLVPAIVTTDLAVSSMLGYVASWSDACCATVGSVGVLTMLLSMWRRVHFADARCWLLSLAIVASLAYWRAGYLLLVGLWAHTGAPFGPKRKRADDQPWCLTLHKEAYDEIQAGRKTYEGRPESTLVHTAIRDLLAFRYLRNSSKPRLVCRVEQSERFENVEAMVKHVGWKRLVPRSGSAAKAVARYRSLGTQYTGSMKAIKVQFLRLEA